MSEDQTTLEAGDGISAQDPKTRSKAKRDIFRFTGEKPTAINLEHVTHVFLEGKKITFNFYSSAIFIELEDESSAANIFEIILKSWASDVVE